MYVYVLMWLVSVVVIVLDLRSAGSTAFSAATLDNLITHVPNNKEWTSLSLGCL